MSLKLSTIYALTWAITLIMSSGKADSQALYLGNEKHTGVYNGNVQETPTLAWKFKTNGKVFSSPVVFNNTVFTGSNDSCLYALDKNTGKLIWKFKTEGTVNSSAAVANNTVYFNSFDGFLYAVNATTGKLLWKFDMGKDKIFQAPNMHGVSTGNKIVEDPWDMYLASPVVNKKMVFVGSGNGNFFAVDAKTGKQAWKFKTGGVIHSSPALSGDSVYFGSWDSYIYALNATNGKEIWKFKTGTDTVYHNQVGFQSSAAIDGKVLYIGCRDANMRAIDRFTGKLLWSFPTQGSWIISSPAVYNNKVYFGTSDTHRLIALDAGTGNLIFDKSAKTFVFSSPSIAGDKLFVGTFCGFLYGMDCNNGNTRSVFRTPASEEKGSLYLNADSTINAAKVFASQTWDGMVQSVEDLYSMGSVMSTPAISGNTIYFGSTDGYIYALR